MATRSRDTRGKAAQIDWPVIGMAAAMAGGFVTCLTLTAWVAGRGLSFPGAAGSAWERVSRRSGGQAANEWDPLDGGTTRSVGEVRSHAERGNEERGVQPVPPLVYPETDIGREALSASSAGGRGSGRAAVPALTQPGSAGYAGVPASPSRPEREVPKREVANEPCCQVEFARDPTEAALLAKQEHKLMFVLHVSGNFEESKFT